MGNARSKKDFEPCVPVPGAEMVLTVFYDINAWEDGVTAEGYGYMEALQSMGYETTWADNMLGGESSKIVRDGTEFNFMMGSGVGREAVRPRFVSALHNVGVVVLFVRYDFIKGDYQYIFEEQLFELTKKELKDIQILVVVSPAPKGDNLPEAEMIRETKENFKAYSQKVEYVCVKETKEATMDHVITTTAGWIKQRKEKKEAAGELNKSVALFSKMKTFAKSFPKKCYVR